jgi:hypothetical protein
VAPGQHARGLPGANGKIKIHLTAAGKRLATLKVRY